MEHIVFLVHRIPYPPNKGDKIRSYHLLRALSQQYRVHLGCFVDDPLDWAYADKLLPFCESLHCVPLKKSSRYLKGLKALTSGQPITLPYYRSSHMQRWVTETIERYAIERALVFSSSMAQYVDGKRFSHLKRVIDFVDVDSDKWAQYAAKKHGLVRWVYQREYRTLRHYENRIASIFDSCVFVSQEEARLFSNQLPADLAPKVAHLLNGVDTGFFNPSAGFDGAQIPCLSPYLVFTGAMDYWANVDAMQWFCQQVWPRLKQRHPALHFYIVGGNPTAETRALERLPGVHVTGRVQDVRPYLHRAELVVAPLQIARGIQNKVLEAMAMGKPVVATSMAMEGIHYGPDLCLEIADSPNDFTMACNRLLARQQPVHANANRAWVVNRFGWDQTLGRLPALLEGAPP
ncbi:TIGR03087 family PEP-CTERM/XrtA system glycosyltransferase [Marinobacterium aestuariivivens]|uniref:TIGR03087 family PEP-CTERM/XrtA system glycosyltransferase n=1 Tax=Marinobacterium aestuariivivens TaxID=1698799 RepID=A0ABW1ZV18_9GAMM